MLKSDKEDAARMLGLAEREPMPDEVAALIEDAERLLANRSNQRTFRFEAMAVLLAGRASPVVEKARKERKKELDNAMKNGEWDEALSLCQKFPTNLTVISDIQNEARRMKHEAERARMEEALKT